MPIYDKSNLTCNFQCNYCHADGTPILMGDLAWKPIEEIVVGDTVIGFEKRKNGFSVVKSTVEKTFHRTTPIIELEWENGIKTRCSTDHKWWRSRGYYIESHRATVGTNFAFFSHPVSPPIEDEDYVTGYLQGMMVGDGSFGYCFDKNNHIQRFSDLRLIDNEPIERTFDFFKQLGVVFDKFKERNLYGIRVRDKSRWDAVSTILSKKIESTNFIKGWLSGIFDAEGSYSGSLRISNYDVNVKQQIKKHLTTLGFNSVIESVSVRLLGGTPEIVRFFSLTNPALTRKKSIKITRFKKVKLKSKRLLDENTVYNLQTSTGNYVASGFHSKNCYEHPFRPKPEEIDYDVVEGAIRALHQKLYKGEPNTRNAARVGLHGGEPLFRDKKYIERLLKVIYELDGRSSIQTNGYLIDDDIIEMFKKYKTSVGLSIDGPWPCNELRGSGSKKERKAQTNKILKTMNRLQEEGIGVSVIAVIHKKNASKSRRELLKMWVLDLHRRKISGRLNPCCCGKDSIDLTPEEAVDFYTDMYDFMLENGIRGWSPFRDIINSLKGESSVVCVYRECDPYATSSCYPVFKDGGVGSCLRLYSDGKTYLRSDEKSTIRSDVLRQTDCKDCRWWENCYGGCTGLSKDFDWRNKDRFCLLYKALFQKTVNVFKMVDMKRTTNPLQPQRGSRRPGGHSDGDEHIDGDERHMDSDANYVWEDDPRQSGGGYQDWTDGIEHLDGDERHLDSN